VEVMDMHFNILDSPRRQLLKSVVEMPELNAFYLAGGTALSLQLGLRESHDFDFFTSHRFNEAALLAAFRERFSSVNAINIESDTCDMLVDQVQVSLFRYPYPMVSELVEGEGPWQSLKMAGIDDIAVMKWGGIGNRGSRKDFYDLYQIYHRIPGFDSPRLWENARRKYGANFDLGNMIMGLNYFDDAEDEILPRTFVYANWNNIKTFFRDIQRQMIALEEAQIR
jgi:hypothetical protein